MTHVYYPTAGTSIRPGKVASAHHDFSRGNTIQPTDFTIHATSPYM